MSRALVLLLLLTADAARAEGTWGIAVGVGPAVHRVTGITSSDFPSLGTSTRLGASARLDAGYRVVDSIALGAHLGIGYVDAARYEHSISGSATYVPLEAGLGAQFTIVDRLRIAPWAGFLDTAAMRFRACGLEVGFDVLVRGLDRISAVASFATAGLDGFGVKDNGSRADQTFSAGIAYRYW